MARHWRQKNKGQRREQARSRWVPLTRETRRLIDALRRDATRVTCMMITTRHRGSVSPRILTACSNIRRQAATIHAILSQYRRADLAGVFFFSYSLGYLWRLLPKRNSCHNHRAVRRRHQLLSETQPEREQSQFILALVDRTLVHTLLQETTRGAESLQLV